MTTQKFNELLRNISDEDCFQKLYDEYYTLLIKFGLMIFKNRYTAEDAAQDVFNYFLTHKITSEIRRPKVWLYTIVKHYFSKYKTNTVPLKEDDIVATDLLDYLQIDVQMAIKKLAPDERELILLKWYCGFSLKEIAFYYKRTVPSVWKRHERILKKLKKYYVELERD